MWAKNPAEKTNHPRQVENHTYRPEPWKARTILTDLGPKEEKQMVLCHVPLIIQKASNACQPGQGANGVVASTPPRPGLCPVAAQPRDRIECWVTKPTHGDTLAEGPQGCHLTLECTGISSTPGDTQPGGEIAETPWELENRMEPALVRVRAS